MSGLTAASCTIAQLPDSAWSTAHPLLLEPQRPELTAEASVEARAAYRGTARSAAVAQIAEARSSLQQ